MRKYFILLLLFSAFGKLFAQPENPGPYYPGWTSVSLQREGRNLNCRVYYPALSDGSEAPVDDIHAPYPVVAFGHGFLMQTSYYISLFRHLASHGYIVIAPQFPDVQHELLAYDLNFCLRYVKNSNANPSHRFFGLVDTLYTGVSGHSMGGGAALLAAVHDSSITVTAPLAAAETSTPVIPRMNLIKSVVYLISAQNDGVTPVFSTQMPMYQNALPVKALPMLKGGNHVRFLDVSTFDWTDPNGYLTRAEQLRLTRRYITSVFGLFLKRDTSFFKYAFGEKVNSDTSVSMTMEMKPLMPIEFSVVNAIDSFHSPAVMLKWRSTYSLNLTDTVRHIAIIARDSLFNNSLYISGPLTDTSISRQLDPGAYFWKIKAYTSDVTYRYSRNSGRFTVAPPASVSDGDAPDNNLYIQNYPNPFGDKTNIDFIIPESNKLHTSASEGAAVSARLIIYDILGRETAVLLSSAVPPGKYEIEFNPAKYGGLAPGVYFVRLLAGNEVISRKMIKAN